jgi:hypothetical protein
MKIIFNCDLNTSDIDNITMKDIFWTDLLKFIFELKSKEKGNTDKRYVSCGTINLFIIVTFPNKIKLLLLHD